MACTGRPLKALEDDMRDGGVGAAPTTLQTEMMPSRKKIVFCHCQKKTLAFWSSAACGQIVASDKSGAWRLRARHDS